ncbi:MAG TPA: hypothetical protein VJ719_06145 [Chthoniobacterales bacterium]|nr:hypothetical protein [Chthoniobacterales bacterium]
MSRTIVSVLRSIAAVVGGYLMVAAGTILTFNVLVGQVTVDSSPLQLLLGTLGAAISGLAGGILAAIISPRLPLLHAAGVLIFIAADTASVLMKGSGPVWFDLAGSSVLGSTVLLGGWMFCKLARYSAEEFLRGSAA